MAIGAPGPIRAPALHQQLGGFVRARVREHSEPRDRAQPVEEVVVPVVRPVDVQPFGMDDITGAGRSKQAVLQQQLARASSRSARAPVAGLAVILGQAPDRCERFVKRGVVGIRVLVAVPSAVRPLRSEQHLRQMPDPEALRHAEVAAHRKRVALHRRMAPFLAGNYERLRGRRDPIEHGHRCRAGGPVSALHTQLDH